MSKQRSWDQLVAAGRRAAQAKTRAHWELGDLALEAEPLARTKGREPGSHLGTNKMARLRKFADEIGMPCKGLMSYRFVAGKWPVDKRVAAASFWAHRDLASHPQRFKLLARLVAEAERKSRALTPADVLAAQGKVRVGSRRTVSVHEHERRRPGTVPTNIASPLKGVGGLPTTTMTPIVTGRQLPMLEAALRALTVEQIGEHIERCWAIIEEKTRAEAT